jgi:hypothetical protein
MLTLTKKLGESVARKTHLSIGKAAYLIGAASFVTFSTRPALAWSSSDASAACFFNLTGTAVEPGVVHGFMATQKPL